MFNVEEDMVMHAREAARERARTSALLEQVDRDKVRTPVVPTSCWRSPPLLHALRPSRREREVLKKRDVDQQCIEGTCVAL